KLDDDPSQPEPEIAVLPDELPASALAETAPGMSPLVQSIGKAIVGTPLYIAPEVWRGEPATPRSDVYSLGALLYEVASGRPPHTGDTLAELREKALARPAPALAIGPTFDSFAELILRFLAREPHKRPGAEVLR